MLKYEIKKILGNKFVLIFFAFLFALNALLSFVGAPEARNELEIEEIDIETQAAVRAIFERYKEDPEEFLRELEIMVGYVDQLKDVQTKMNLDSMLFGKDLASLKIEDYWPEYSEEIQQKINEYATTYRYFVNTKKYIDESLPAQYNEVIRRAESSLKEYATLGMSEQSYDYRYQETIIDVYSVNKNLPIEIEYASGWSAYFSYTNGNICLILFLLVLVPCFLLDERSNGTEPILRATKRGRLSLVLTKYLALLTVICISVLSFSAVTFAIYGLEYGGYSSLSNFIQVFEEYAYCPYIVSVGEYLLLSLVIKILALFAIGSLLLTVSLLLKNHALTYLVGLVIGGGNFIFYFIDYLDINHPARLLNLFTMMDTEVCFSRYYAINLLGQCVDYLPAILLFLGVLLAVTAVCTTILYCRIPGGQRIKRLATKKISLPNIAIPCLHRSIGGYELHKHLVAGKYLLLILAVLLVKGYTVHTTEAAAYSFSDEMYKEYVTFIEGEVTDEKLAYLEDERARIDGIIASESDMKDRLGRGEISSNEYWEYENELQEAKARDPIFARVEGQRDHLLMLRDMGIDAHFVYTTSWDQMFSRGFDYVLYAFILIFASIIFTTEYSAGVSGILRATKRGRKELFVVKYTVALGVCAVLAIVFGLMDHYKLVELYTFTGGGSPVQSLPILGGVSWNITLNQYLMIFETLRVIGSILLAAVTVSVSLMTKKPVNTMAIVASITMIPYVLRSFGMDFVKYLDFTCILSGQEYMALSFGSGLYFVIFTIAVLGGCAAVVWTARRIWIRT